MALNSQPKNFQYWATISATPNAFDLDAGSYGVTLHAAVWGTAALQKLLPDGATFVTVATFVADGYQEIHVPAGQYQLLLTTVTGLIGEVALIAKGSG